jgi:DNA-binding transcriptional MerR regulator
MRIGELSRRSGLSRDTIRFYERNGLLSSAPSSGDTNNYRDYPEQALERLMMIGEAREAGFSVSELKLLFDHLESGDAFEADGFLDRKIAEVAKLIERSTRLLAMLKRAKNALRGPH